MYFFRTINNVYTKTTDFANRVYEELLEHMQMLPDLNLLFPTPDSISITYMQDYYHQHEEAFSMMKLLIVNHLKENYLKYGGVLSIELIDYILFLNSPEENDNTLIASSSLSIIAAYLMISAHVSLFHELRSMMQNRERSQNAVLDEIAFENSDQAEDEGFRAGVNVNPF